MSKIIFSFSENKILAESLSKCLNLPTGQLIVHHFPDHESCIRIGSDVKNKEIILICSLNNPDTKILPLFFFSKTAKELGAKKITLIAPYLSYMRQDKAFRFGESVTSNIFANLISYYFDELITIDPHLHRHKSLSEIYSIPTTVLHADLLIAEWIKNNISNAVLVGPDEESEQWVSTVAKKAAVNYIILRKKREGDKKVKIFVPHVNKHANYIPLLIDDIISTGYTMIETIKHLKKAKMKAPICIGIHAIFAGNAFEELKKAGTAKIISCNTITHLSNRIDISSLFIESCMKGSG